MPYVANRPVLIVEGQGDVDAMPAFLRRMAHHKNIFGLTPLNQGIRGGSIGKFRNAGELGRYVRLAALREGSDSIVIALDCDDDCAKLEVEDMSARLAPLAQELNKKIAVCFFVKEFENLFLHCLEDLALRHDDLGFQLPCPVAPDKIDDVRGAKGLLNRQMLSGTYKETRDQARFVHALDLDRLVSQSRSARHVSTCIDFLQAEDASLVYPVSR